MGGRNGPAALDGRYRPHVHVEAGQLLGVEVTSGERPEVPPGESATVELRLVYDDVDYSALAPGVHFAILEGPKVIGSGEVLKPSSAPGPRTADRF
jgi:translation elongation factor EF-Tu-like GTPase